ncbi:MAG: LD-carboxypeptidase [Cyanobacteria bacterium HKST-UBA04]|nr:LD-carboxypeptidase [Cyanobacteria bacterium HKST-UBA04]
MQPMQLAKPVRPGDTLAVISPAAPSSDEAFAAGVAYLEQCGYTVRLMPHAQAKRYYLAGDDEGRLADFHAAFADDSIDGILCARGGYGCLRLLDKIDWSVVRANPKVFVGFSDLTTLLLPMVEQAGLVGFHGPMLTSNLIEQDAFSQQQLWNMIGGVHQYPYVLPNQSPYQCLHPGRAEGRLMGGNISLLSSLCGTPWQPNLEGALLFIEDWHEQFYTLDRQWQQLRLSGMLDGIAGLLLGDFIEISDAGLWPDYNLADFFRELTADLKVPTGLGFSIGHGCQNVTVPIGVTATLESTSGRLEIVSSPLQSGC